MDKVRYKILTWIIRSLYGWCTHLKTCRWFVGIEMTGQEIIGYKRLTGAHSQRTDRVLQRNYQLRQNSTYRTWVDWHLFNTSRDNRLCLAGVSERSVMFMNKSNEISLRCQNVVSEHERMWWLEQDQHNLDCILLNRWTISGQAVDN